MIINMLIFERSYDDFMLQQSYYHK